MLLLTAHVFSLLLQTCVWGPATAIGSLPAVINESSGLAVSRRIPNRTYHANDSGDTGRFFVTDLAGRDLRIVNVQGFSPVDVEDLAMGKCDAATDCLFLADIGDNHRNRKNIELVVVEERDTFPANVPARYRVRLQYPDGPHDAESLAVHPDGNIYIITKDIEIDGFSLTSGVARIYRLKPEQWRTAGTAIETLERVATIDLRKILPDSNLYSRLPTAMDIAPDGSRFLLLTYGGAIEFFIDLSKKFPAPDEWKEGLHYRRIAIQNLETQEAIGYLPDGKAFIYDSERSFFSSNPKVMRVDCR